MNMYILSTLSYIILSWPQRKGSWDRNFIQSSPFLLSINSFRKRSFLQPLREAGNYVTHIASKKCGKVTNLIHKGCAPSWPSHLPKAPPPNITLGIRISNIKRRWRKTNIQILAGDSDHLKSQSCCWVQGLIACNSSYLEAKQENHKFNTKLSNSVRPSAT